MSYLFALLSPSCTELKALRDTATYVDSGNIKIDNSDHICICIWSIFALVKRLNWLVVVLGGSVRNSKVIFLSYTWEYVRLDAIRNTATSGSMYIILDFKKTHPDCVVKYAFFNDKDNLCIGKNLDFLGSKRLHTYLAPDIQNSSLELAGWQYAPVWSIF